jgi:hypothetical protein
MRAAEFLAELGAGDAASTSGRRRQSRYCWATASDGRRRQFCAAVTIIPDRGVTGAPLRAIAGRVVATWSDCVSKPLRKPMPSPIAEAVPAMRTGVPAGGAGESGSTMAVRSTCHPPTAIIADLGNHRIAAENLRRKRHRLGGDRRKSKSYGNGERSNVAHRILLPVRHRRRRTDLKASTSQPKRKCLNPR